MTADDAMTVRDYAVLQFDGVCLLLPQENVAAIETAANCEAGSAVPGALATLKAGGAEWPLFALDADARPRAELPPAHRVCVAFNGAAGEVFAIACEQVGQLSIDRQRELVPLRDCMRLPGAPIESLSLYHGRLLQLADVDAMPAYLTTAAAA